MSSVDGADRQADDALREPDAATHFVLLNVRALMDVVFGGAALALLLMWLVLAIAGGRLG